LIEILIDETWKANMEKEITVGVVAFDQDGKVLLIKRRDPPAIGLWTLPMGHVNEGENLIDAAIREVSEETGLLVGIYSKLGIFQHENIELTMFLGKIVNGILMAGDDATDVKLETLNMLPARGVSDSKIQKSDLWAYQMHQEILTSLGKLGNLNQPEKLFNEKV
jgi:8-oxo-dGTP diphosphatase